jgi:ASC-1-like (ASCH) protein
MIARRDGDKMVCFPVKRRYFDKIIAGEKRTEYRACSDHWQRYLSGVERGDPITFQCGQDVAQGTVDAVHTVERPEHIPKEFVPTKQCFAVQFSLNE